MLEKGVEIFCGGLCYKIVEAHPEERRWEVSPFCFYCPDDAEATDEVVVGGTQPLSQLFHSYKGSSRFVFDAILQLMGVARSYRVYRQRPVFDPFGPAFHPVSHLEHVHVATSVRAGE